MTDANIYKSIVKLTEDVTEVKGLMNGLITSVHEGFEFSKQSDKEIIKHQEITNGRVTKLECETSVVRWFQRNPWKFAIIFVLTVGISAAVYASFRQNITIDDIAEILVKKGF